MRYKKIRGKRNKVSYYNESKTLVIDIDDVIDGWWGFSASRLKQIIREYGKVEDIKVNLYSPGGSIFEGFEIYNILKDHSAKVEMNVGALAASIAFTIMLAGDTIRVHNNSTGVIHNPWVIMAGDSDELRHEADVLDKMKKQIIDIITASGNIGREEISALMDTETYLDAEEMITYGFADELIDSEADVKNFVFDSRYQNCFRKAPVSIANMITFSKEKRNTTNIPAQAGGNVNLNKKGGKMPPKTPIPQPADVTPQPANVTPSLESVAVISLDGKAIAKAERERIESIRVTGEKLGVRNEVVTKLIDDGVDLTEAYPQLVAAMTPGGGTQTVSGSMHVQSSDINLGLDESGKFRDSVVTAFSAVAGLPVDQKRLAEVNSQDVPRTISALLRTVAFNEGKRGAHTWNNEQCADYAMSKFRNDLGSITSTTLSNIFADTMNKGFGVGQGNIRTTYRQWTRAQSVNDFRQFSLLTASTFSDLQKIPEGQSFTKGKIADKKELGQADTFGKSATLTRQAMVNDDMQVLTRVPILMGGAWERLKNRTVYDLLRSNTLVGPTMNEDSVALFNTAGHANYLASGSGTVPSTASINVGITAMMTQKMLLPDDNETSDGEATNVVPASIIIPPALRQSVLELVKSPYKSDTPVNTVVGQGNSITYNTVDFMDIVVDAYLTLATGWYLAANPNEIDTFVLLNLNGREAPFVKSEDAAVGDALGISYQVYGDFGVMAGDWRGMYFNYGA